jgi:6-phosphogluconolactonase
MSRFHLRIYRDKESLSKAVADQVVHILEDAIGSRGIFHFVLTGGNTVQDLYKLLAGFPHVNRIDWSKGLFFWGDERIVPPDDPESNYGQAHQLFLSHIGLKPENICRIRGELKPTEAAQDYQFQLSQAASEGLAWPRFDLVLLSLGSDGHIASIFPGKITEAERNSPVLVTHAEYEGRPTQRVSLTPIVFNSSRRIIVLAVGESKAVALENVLSGDGDPEMYPALRIHPDHGEVMWFVDESAASLLPERLRDQNLQ